MISTQRLHQLLCLFLLVATANSAPADEVLILQPDGKPAVGATVFQTHLGSQMYADMEMGMAMEDEMHGGSGMMMGAGGYGEEMMGMDGEGMSATIPTSFSFINGKPLQSMDGSWGTMSKADDAGKAEINTVQGRPYAGSILALHSKGYSFVPRGSRNTGQITLRQGGSLIIDVPEGVDASRYQCLACWQNGFAWPSIEMINFSTPPKFKLGDWRFKPHFKLFRTAKLGESFEMPPGEVRVTIVPMKWQGKNLDELDTETLTKVLHSGGPSQIALVSQAQDLPQRLDFGLLAELAFQAPKQISGSLPDWGDQPTFTYTLSDQARSAGMSAGLDDMGSYEDAFAGGLQKVNVPAPNARDISTMSAFLSFLNRSRESRSGYSDERIPSRVTDQQMVHFGLVPPGSYRFERRQIGEQASQPMKLNGWQAKGSQLVGIIGGGSTNPKQSIFQLDRNGSKLRITSTAGTASTGTASTGDASTGDADQNQSRTNGLSVGERNRIRQLRVEIEGTIERLVKYRRKLLELEQSASAVMPDEPYGQDDPFGYDGGGGPSGGFNGPADSKLSDSPLDNPFGASKAADEFGADPFGN